MGDGVQNRTGHTGSFSTLISYSLHPEVYFALGVCLGVWMCVKREARDAGKQKPT